MQRATVQKAVRVLVRQSTSRLNARFKAVEARVRRAIQLRESREADEIRKSQLEHQLRMERIARRLPRAKKGLDRIMAIGQDPYNQRLLQALARERNREAIVLYSATRPSGDAWDYPNEERGQGTRDVIIKLTPTHVEVLCGSLRSGMTTWKIPYKDNEVHGPVTEIRDRKEISMSVSDFLGKIATPHTFHMSILGHPDQRTSEWDPEEVAFQVLVSCARKDAFERYVVKCLKLISSRD